MRVAPKAVKGVDVGAIDLTSAAYWIEIGDSAHRSNHPRMTIRKLTVWFFAMVFFAASGMSVAAVLPDNRSDLMYHYYKGGGVKVDGPALLVREGVSDKASLAASYYEDSVSGASIDVLTTASPYRDKRQEYNVTADYLYRDSLMTFAYTTSKESDYLADTYSFNIAHDLFSGLTTVNLGYTTGHDLVMRNHDPTFQRTLDRYQYRVGLSQILTKSLIASLNYEAVIDDGYINNPYRYAIALGVFTPEKYPTTRDSHALAMQLRKGLDFFDKQEWRSSIKFDYRYFWDTWEITANTVELGYQQYLTKRWLTDMHYRYYSQSKAVFYSDNFPSSGLLYMARDKELSTFNSHALGFKISYIWIDDRPFKLSQSFAYDYLHFNYDDFTDIRTGALYSFDASMIQLFVSFWY